MEVAPEGEAMGRGWKSLRKARVGGAEAAVRWWGR